MRSHAVFSLEGALLRRVRVHSGARRAGVVVASVLVGLGGGSQALASEIPGEPLAPATIPTTEASVPESSAPPIDPVTLDVSLDLPDVETAVEAAVESLEEDVISTLEALDITQNGALEGDVRESTALGADTAPDTESSAPGSVATEKEGSTADGGATASSAGVPLSEPATGRPAPDDDGTASLVEGLTHVAPTALESENAPGRYHDENSKYHSAFDSAIEPWIWEWILDVDCAGNLLSTSTESGTSESPNWVWEWIWEWCGDGVPPFADTILEEQFEEEAVGPMAPPAEGGEDRTAAPWEWSWTFTFCGDTYSLSPLAAGAVPLAWTWDWSWYWTCRSEAASNPAPDETPLPPSGEGAQVWVPAAPASFVPAGIQPAPTLPHADSALTLALPAAQVVDDLLGSTIALLEALLAALDPPLRWPETATAVLGGASEDTFTPPTRLDVPRAGSGVAGRDRSAGEPGDNLAPAPAGATVPAARPPAEPDGGEAVARRGAPRATTARPAPERRAPRRLPGPPGPESHSYTASGLVPGGAVLGAAVLVTLLVLAVPRLGRRLLAARELRPRSAYRPPIDHPG